MLEESEFYKAFKAEQEARLSNLDPFRLRNNSSQWHTYSKTTYTSEPVGKPPDGKLPQPNQDSSQHKASKRRKETPLGKQIETEAFAKLVDAELDQWTKLNNELPAHLKTTSFAKWLAKERTSDALQRSIEARLAFQAGQLYELQKNQISRYPQEPQESKPRVDEESHWFLRFCFTPIVISLSIAFVIDFLS